MGNDQVLKPLFSKFLAMMSMKGLGKGKGKGKGKTSTLSKFEPSQRVWIGGLAPGTTWKEVQEHMNQSGTTKWVEVFEKSNTAAVAYETAEEVEAAVAALNGSVLKDAVL